jgi:hypothetical protein
VPRASLAFSIPEAATAFAIVAEPETTITTKDVDVILRNAVGDFPQRVPFPESLNRR